MSGKTKLPGLGVAPKLDNTKAVEKWMRHVNEVLQVFAGVKGDRSKLDSVVTFRDLQSAGIATGLAPGSGSGSGGGTGGTGGGGVTLPPYSTPPAPTGLTVTAGFSSLFLEWDVSLYAYLSHAEVWRAEEDNLGVAAKVLDSIGNLAADHVGPSSGPRYYWVRYISNRGDPGPFNSGAGTVGETALDPEYLFDVLEGSLDYQGLAERIDLIDAPGTGLVDSLAQEILNRAAAVSAEATARAAAILAEINARIAGDDALQLSVDSISTTINHGTTGLAAAHTRITGVEVVVDEVTGDMEALALEMDVTTATANAAVAAASAAVTTANTAQARLNNVNGEGMSVESLAEAVESLTASSGEDGTLAAAAFTKASAVETRINNVNGAGGGKTVETLATESATLAAAVNHGTTGLAAAHTTANSAVARLNNTGAGQTIEALTTSVSTLNATITHGTSGLSAAHSRITTAENRMNNTGTGGLSLESIAANSEATRAAVNHGTTGLAATKTVADSAVARLNNTGNGQTIEALTSSFTGLSSTVNHGTTGLGAAHTRSQNLETRAANVGGTGRTLEVLGTDFSSLRSQVLDPATGLDALATIVTSHTTSITSQGNTLNAQATTISQLQTTVNGHTAAIQNEATVRANETGQLFAKATLKLDVNGYVTGWSMNNDGQQGEMIIVADRFSIAPVATNPAAADGSPFFHLTAPTTVNGVLLPAGTYLKTAYIGDATITNAKIGSVAVEKITGNIASFIQGNFNVLQSSNFSSALQRGWRFNVNGSHEIYGGPGSLIVADKIQANAVEIIDTKSLKPNAVSIWEIVIQDAEVIIPQTSNPAATQQVFEAVVDFTEAYPDTPVRIEGYFLGTFNGQVLSGSPANPYGGPRVRWVLLRNNLVIAGSDLINGSQQTSSSSWGGEWVWIHQQNNQGYMLYNVNCEFQAGGGGFPFLDFPGPGIHTYQVRVAAYAPLSPSVPFRVHQKAWLKFDAGKR